MMQNKSERETHLKRRKQDETSPNRPKKRRAAPVYSGESLSRMKNYFFQGAHAQFSIYIPELINEATPAIFTLYAMPYALSAYYQKVKEDKITLPYDIDKVLQAGIYLHSLVKHGEEHKFNKKYHIHYKLFEFNDKILEKILTILVDISSQLPPPEEHYSLYLLEAEEASRFLQRYRKFMVLENQAFSQGAIKGFFNNYLPKLPLLMTQYFTHSDARLFSQVNKTTYESAKNQESEAHEINSKHLIK